MLRPSFVCSLFVGLLSFVAIADATTIGSGGILENQYSDCRCTQLVGSSCVPQSTCVGTYSAYNKQEWIFGMLVASDSSQSYNTTFYSDSACTMPIAGSVTSVGYSTCQPSRSEANRWSKVDVCAAPNANVGGGTTHQALAEITFSGSSCTGTIVNAAAFPAGLCLGTSTVANGATTQQSVAVSNSAGTLTVHVYTDMACSAGEQTAVATSNQCLSTSMAMFESGVYVTPNLASSGAPVGTNPATLAATWNQQCSGAASAAAMNVGVVLLVLGVSFATLL